MLVSLCVRGSQLANIILQPDAIYPLSGYVSDTSHNLLISSDPPSLSSTLEKLSQVEKPTVKAKMNEIDTDGPIET